VVFRSISATLVWAVVLGRLSFASASDIALSWSAPHDCPDRERVGQGLSTRLGRPVRFGSDAPLAMRGVIAAYGGGYELTLETRSSAGSERRVLHARSCAELTRASLLIGSLLLSAHSGAAADRPDMPLEPAAPETAAGDRGWFLAVRARSIGDLGTLAPVSVGPGLGIGVGIAATYIELGALWLPPRDLGAAGTGASLGQLQLTAASLAGCQELLPAAKLGPCLQLEAGRLSGRGEALASASRASSAWWVGSLGLRAGAHLWGPIYGFAQAWAGLPLIQPQFAVHGLGVVHQVPWLLGRLELSLEGRL
jgi:hypothetical protein